MQYPTREQRIEMVKALGQEVIDRAEDIVGEADGLNELDIWLNCPTDSLPSIDVTRSYASKECFKLFSEFMYKNGQG